ncbi:MAG: M15 family metallopeptidase [Actinomycetota bacterium]
MAWNTTDPSRVKALVVDDVPFPGGADQVLVPLWRILIPEACRRSAYGLDKGENWGYAPRDVADSPGFLSFHGRGGGRAVDVNAPDNARGTRGDIPMKFVRLLEEFGMEWGGRWGWTDPMHFQAGRSIRYYRRALKRARRRFVEQKLAYRISGRLFSKPRRAAQFLRGKLRNGRLHDEFHVTVVRRKARGEPQR